ncbi:MAG: hypothetical protein CHACPFDD_01652 [Phycisphaerae bacterium]|nr:hypothetical protein [Phycisphaerae bacterium]
MNRLIATLAFSSVLAAAALAQDFESGDVFAATANGEYKHYDPAGNFLQILSTGLGGYTTGMATDASGNLYGTNFSAGNISRFTGPPAPHNHSIWASPGGTPESIVFDGSGNAFVGNASQSVIRKYDPAGNELAAYPVQIEARGTDWVDLASDQCTIFYTSEGRRVMRYNTCTMTQLADFNANPLPGSVAYALRIMPDGGVLVADTQVIVRLDNAGNVVTTYDVAGEDQWFALNLDPDGTSFWSGSFDNDRFFKFDIATGNVLIGPIQASTGGFLFGLSVYGERTAGREICDNDLDDDGDGFVDCDDPDCATFPGCQGPPGHAGRGHFGKKGSVLILPKIEVHWADLDGSGDIDVSEVVRDTFVQLENDGPSQIQVKMYFIQGDPPIDNGVEFEPGCIKIDFTGILTAEQPAYWSAFSGAPGIGVPASPLNRWDELDPGTPPGRADPNGSDRRVLRGYIIIYACNVDELPIRYNRLSASATIIDYLEVAGSEYNAYAFAAGTGVEEGQVVNDKYELNFDGIEFDKAPGKLLLEFYADSTAQLANTALTGSQSVVTTVDTELTLVPLNADLHDCIPTTTLAEYVLHDQNENRRSFTSTHCITCWSSLWLDQIHPIFTRFFLQQDKGKARIDSKAGITFCDTEFDETTTATSLLGVAIRRLDFAGVGVAHAGSSLVIQEEEVGSILLGPTSGGGEIHDGGKDVKQSGFDPSITPASPKAFKLKRK